MNARGSVVFAISTGLVEIEPRKAHKLDSGELFVGVSPQEAWTTEGVAETFDVMFSWNGKSVAPIWKKHDGDIGNHVRATLQGPTMKKGDVMTAIVRNRTDAPAKFFVSFIGDGFDAASQAAGEPV